MSSIFTVMYYRFHRLSLSYPRVYFVFLYFRKGVDKICVKNFSKFYNAKMLIQNANWEIIKTFSVSSLLLSSFDL